MSFNFAAGELREANPYRPVDRRTCFRDKKQVKARRPRGFTTARTRRQNPTRKGKIFETICASMISEEQKAEVLTVLVHHTIGSDPTVKVDSA